MPQKLNMIYKGKSERILLNNKRFPDSSVDLIITSPPYADRRKYSYGGVESTNYVNWFLAISKELYRILKPKGSMVINIKEHVKEGERQTYVLELILALKEQGWRWVEEYCWYKTTSFPGKWPNRFRDSFERCLHFTKEKKFNMYQEAVKVPIGDWAQTRFKSMTKKDFVRHASQNNEHLGRNVSNWLNRQEVYPHNVLIFDEEHYVYPTNVIELSPVTNNRNHSACFPIELPSWFILLFCPEGGIVLDPFSGIGTTAMASRLLQRNYLGVEKETKYIEEARKNLKELEKELKLR